MDAKKQTKSAEDAFALLEGIDEIYAARRNNVVHLDLKETKPSRAEIAAVLLGPTGNLRAPTVRKGRTLLLGFDEGTYRKYLK